MTTRKPRFIELPNLIVAVLCILVLYIIALSKFISHYIDLEGQVSYAQNLRRMCPNDKH